MNDEMKVVKLTELMASRILKFFARSLGYRSLFYMQNNKDGTWRIVFGTEEHGSAAMSIGTGKLPPSVDIIRFNHKPSCKEVVSKMLKITKDGKMRVDSIENDWKTTKTLVMPHMTLEQLLIKMDLEVA